MGEAGSEIPVAKPEQPSKAAHVAEVLRQVESNFNNPEDILKRLAQESTHEQTTSDTSTT